MVVAWVNVPPLEIQDKKTKDGKDGKDGKGDRKEPKSGTVASW